jgi:hypothetical protein
MPQKTITCVIVDDKNANNIFSKPKVQKFQAKRTNI